MRADAIVCRVFRVLRHGRFAWAVLAAIVILLLSHGARGSTIKVQVSAGDQYGDGDSKTGNNDGSEVTLDWPNPTHPDPNRTGATGKASATVYAHLNGQVGFPQEIAPSLHGYATGKHGSPGGGSVIQGLATATAIFSDNLYYSNPQVRNDPLLSIEHIYFIHHISGSISATTALGVTFKATITSGYDGNTYGGSVFLNQAGQYNQTLTLVLPALALLSGNSGGTVYPKSTYKLELYVQGGTVINLDHSLNADVTSDFSDTAALDTIYVGDANGNPIPDPTDLYQVSGDDGPYVMGPPTPEPAGLAPLGFAVLGLCRRRRRVRRR